MSVLGKPAKKNGFSKSKVESERTTHQFVRVHRGKEHNSVYNGHLGDSETTKKATVLFLDLEKSL